MLMQRSTCGCWHGIDCLQATQEVLGENSAMKRMTLRWLSMVVVKIPARIRGVDFINQHDSPVCGFTKLVLGVHQYQTSLGSFFLPKLEQRKSSLASLHSQSSGQHSVLSCISYGKETGTAKYPRHGKRSVSWRVRHSV